MEDFTQATVQRTYYMEDGSMETRGPYPIVLYVEPLVYPIGTLAPGNPQKT